MYPTIGTVPKSKKKKNTSSAPPEVAIINCICVFPGNVYPLLTGHT